MGNLSANSELSSSLISLQLTYKWLNLKNGNLLKDSIECMNIFKKCIFLMY